MRYREIELTQNKWAIIDALDYELIAPFTWQAHTAGKNHTWYATSGRVDLPPLRMHALISLPPLGLEVDHIDGNGLHNFRSNLRWATHRQNTINWDQPQGEHGSGFRGVTLNYNRWQARITINGTRHHLGYYDTPEEAAKAYDEAARTHHGRFARLNFVE